MGNKQARKTYEKLATMFSKEKTIARDLPFSSLLEYELAVYLERAVKKQLKEEDWLTLKKEMNLNITPEESEKEAEGRNKRMAEARLYSLLVSGHEDQPEILAAFQGVQLEDTFAPKLDSVQKYTHQKVVELVVALLALVEKSDGQETLRSFYQKVGQRLSSGAEDVAEGLGISMALCLSALLVEPSRLVSDSGVASNLLKMFEEMPSLMFHGWNKQNFVIDRSVDYVKKSLLEQLEKGSEQGKSLESGIKTLCHIGLSRGSIEDLLIAVRLMKEDMDLTKIVQKILDMSGLETQSINLEPSGQNYRFPFEQIYVSDKSEWLTDKAARISAITDGKYIYLHNPAQGLMLLGAGDETIKGKVYKVKGFIAEGVDVQLLYLNKKVYCWTGGKLLKLDTSTMKTKQSKKDSLLSNVPNCKLTANDSRMVIYQESKKAEEGEEAEGTLTIHDFVSKTVSKLDIRHCIEALEGMTLYKNLLILTGKKNYEVLHLKKGKKVFGGESSILEQAALCCNSQRKELFAVYAKSKEEGLVLEEFKLPNVREKTVPVLDARVESLKMSLKTTAKVEEEKTGGMPKTEVETLLGITRGKKPSKRQAEPRISGTVNLLSLLARRSKDAELLISVQESIKAYKCPVAVHTTTQCFETLFTLLKEQHEKFVGTGEEEELEKLWYVVVILNSHFVASRTCDIPLEDLVGIEGAEQNKKLCCTVMKLLMEDDLAGKYKIKNEELIKQVREHAGYCLKNCNLSSKVSAEDIFKQFHECYAKTDLTKDNLEKVITWLQAKDNCELLAERILSQDKEALRFLDEYFGIETEYFSESIHNFTKQSKDTKVQPVYKQLFKPLSSVVEMLFLSSRLRKKNSEAQNVIISVLPEMLYPHLKRVVTEIKDTYAQYKALLVQDLKGLKEAGNLGPKYSEYWKLIQKLLNSEMILFHSFTYLTTAIMGLNLGPDKLVTLAKLLVKPTNPLKELLGIFASEKVDKDFFLNTLEETFENKDRPIESTTHTTVEYNFPEATSIRVYTTHNIEIPPPEKNNITITAASKKTPVATITRGNPSCKISIKATRISIAASINYVHSKKNLPYSGYQLKIMPKVRVGVSVVRVWAEGGEGDFEEGNVADLLRVKRSVEVL